MKSFYSAIEKSLSDSAQNLFKLSSSKELISQVAQATQSIVACYKKGGALFVAGNGGSAADSQHFVAELVVRLYRNRTSLKAFSMTVDTSVLTAIGNDLGFENVYSRQIEGLMQPHDLFFCITTSGKSKNMEMALKTCQKRKIHSLLLTGIEGGTCKNLASEVILCPGATTAQIQEGHVVIYHTLCSLIEEALVEEGLCHYV